MDILAINLVPWHDYHVINHGTAKKGQVYIEVAVLPCPLIPASFAIIWSIHSKISTKRHIRAHLWGQNLGPFWRIQTLTYVLPLLYSMLYCVIMGHVTWWPLLRLLSWYPPHSCQVTETHLKIGYLQISSAGNQPSNGLKWLDLGISHSHHIHYYLPSGWNTTTRPCYLKMSIFSECQRFKGLQYQWPERLMWNGLAASFLTNCYIIFIMSSPNKMG